MLGQECLSEANKIPDGLVVCVSPPRCEFKALSTACWAAFSSRFLDVQFTGGVGVVLGQRAVTDDKQLHIIEQTVARPERVTLVAPDLVKGFTQLYATTLEFDMHHGKAIDQDGDVVTIGVFRTAFALFHLVLVNDLQPVVMDICFIQQSDVFACAVVTRKNLNVVFVDATGLFLDSVVGAGDAGAIEPFPFRVAEGDVVEGF